MHSKLLKNFKFLSIGTLLAATLLPNMGVAAEKTKAAPVKETHWLKKCITNEASIRTCFVTEAIILENKAKKIKIQLASIRIKSVSNSKRMHMYIQVPNKVLLQSGLRYQVDKGKISVAPFSICYDQACEAEVIISDANIKELKKGQIINLHFLKYDGKPVTISVPLIGFTAGINSKGEELKYPPAAAAVAPSAIDTAKEVTPETVKSDDTKNESKTTEPNKADTAKPLPDAKPLPVKK